MTESRPPFPPFDLGGARAKVQAAEDAWNTRDPHRVSLAYTEDSAWRNRDQFLSGRAEIVRFLTAKWEHELDYVLRKSLWGFRGNQPANAVKGTTSRCGNYEATVPGRDSWSGSDASGVARPSARVSSSPARRVAAGLASTKAMPTTNQAMATEGPHHATPAGSGQTFRNRV